MEPKNEGLEDDFPFQRGDFQVPAISFLWSNPTSDLGVRSRPENANRIRQPTISAHSNRHSPVFSSHKIWKWSPFENSNPQSFWTTWICLRKARCLWNQHQLIPAKMTKRFMNVFVDPKVTVHIHSLSRSTE